MTKPRWFVILVICGLACGFTTACTATPQTTETTKDGGTAPSKEQPNEKPPSEPIPDAGITPSPDLDLNMKATDFGCLLKWKKIDHYRLTNKLGLLDEAIKVANSPTGGVFPVGTVIQLVPQEAMVKRRKGWNPKTNDWEFFFLKVSENGSEIVTRGKEEVKNALGGNCHSCHAKAAPQWDLICGNTHGCDPLPFNEKTIESFQNADPRCK